MAVSEEIKNKLAELEALADEMSAKREALAEKYWELERRKKHYKETTTPGGPDSDIYNADSAEEVSAQESVEEIEEKQFAYARALTRDPATDTEFNRKFCAILDELVPLTKDMETADALTLAGARVALAKAQENYLTAQNNLSADRGECVHRLNSAVDKLNKLKGIHHYELERRGVYSYDPIHNIYAIGVSTQFPTNSSFSAVANTFRASLKAYRERNNIPELEAEPGFTAVDSVTGADTVVISSSSGNGFNGVGRIKRAFPFWKK